MAERTFATKATANDRPGLLRKASLQVRARDDVYEREADRAADAVVSGQHLAEPGMSLSHIPISYVQREDGEKPKSEEEKYKEAGKKLGEAFLATDVGKKLKEQVQQDPLVKGAQEAGEGFIGTLPGKVITGAAAAGAVAALAAAHKELPAQLPEIPLDKITPGLKVKITYEGPVDQPTKAMITFSYAEQAGGKKKPAKTKTELQREENARMAQDLAKFRAGLRYEPGSPEAKQQAAEEEDLKRAAFSGVGKLPDLGKASTFPGLKQPPSALQLQFPAPGLGRKPKPFSLLDEELKLKPLDEAGEAKEQDKKKEEDAGVQRKAADESAPTAAPSQVDNVLNAPGRPLDATTRGFMESRFGRDFSRVRIHTDERAAKSARSIDALAYTSGANIVFAAGAYSPHSHSGRHLLAHELAHTVQQSRSPAASHAVQRKPAPAAATPGKWYQQAIDAVDLSRSRMDEQRKQGGFVLAPPYFDNEKALLELCEAVDRKASEEVPKKLDALLKLGLWVHLQILSRALLTELTARMYEMGLEADADRLRKAYAAEDRFGPYNDDIYAARRKVDFYTRLVDGTISAGKADTPEALTVSMHHFVRTFVALRDEYVAIDAKALDEEMRQGHGWQVLRPGMSREEFYRAIRGQIERLQGSLSTLVQQAMDGARRDLESPAPTGSGAALLKALRTAMVGELQEALFPKDESKNITGVSLEITHTTIGKGRGSIGDAFPQDKSTPGRSVPITTYDPDQDYVRELRASLAQFWHVRIDQLDVLGRVYGVLDALKPEKTFADTMSKAEKASDNAQTIRNMSGGRLRLDSDDDWRAFLMQKYNDMVKPAAAAPAAQQGGAAAPAPTATKAATPTEALHAIVELLFAYLRAFTVHARFTNLYDIGETSYLNRPFPRALTGQLVHDCGVYALRVAYMLSLVRKELGLRFRFVVLPVHVSLVITGDKLPTFVIENDQFEEWSPSEFEEKRKQWQKFKDPSTDAAPAGPADEDQFVGELAGAAFIHGPVDMPFRVTDVPPPMANAKSEQKQLWTYYQTTATQDVFGPSSQRKGDPNYLFHKRYLELTEETRRMYNEVVLPFWNKAAPDAWDKLQKALDPASPTPGSAPRTTIPVDDLLTPLGEYSFDYAEALKPLKARYDRFEADERRLSERLRSDPKLSKAGVRLSVGARASLMWHYYWDTHSERIGSYESDLVGRPEGAKEPLEAVTKALQPPFVPRDEKHLEPLD